jgi:hypothetical protein
VARTPRLDPPGHADRIHEHALRVQAELERLEGKRPHPPPCPACGSRAARPECRRLCHRCFNDKATRRKYPLEKRRSKVE